MGRRPAVSADRFLSAVYDWCRSDRDLSFGAFDTFMKFILENFYFDVWRSQAVIRELAFSHEEDCMSDHDRSRAYLHWTHR